jgi:Spy/CpxP family protein refolding chaperone
MLRLETDMTTRKQLLAVLLGAAFAFGSAQALADPPEGYGACGYGSCYGMGPGMMYGYGGYGPGYGMGPGMMYGYGGYGPGYGMGPGMMYGYGQRGGYGMGPWMHGYGGYGPGYGRGWGGGAGLNLTDEQRSKIDQIQQDLRSKQWDLMGKIQDEYARRADAPDAAAAGKADDQITALQQQMVSNAGAARKQVDAVLTKEQREQLRRGGY